MPISRQHDAGRPAELFDSVLSPIPEDQLRADFARTLGHLKRNLHPAPIRLADVPGELRRKFVGQSGRFLLQIQPKVDIWDRDGAERFVRELRTVDAEVAGTPVITFEAIRYMERAYKEGTLYAFLLVGLLRGDRPARARERARHDLARARNALDGRSDVRLRVAIPPGERDSPTPRSASRWASPR